ncbi:MAG: hypothetical protein F6K41_10195 [Symploca sp. SIO3E6]|nr:hypothetical protein [Caldora sp. SIO3E6]
MCFRLQQIFSVSNYTVFPEKIANVKKSIQYLAMRSRPNTVRLREVKCATEIKTYLKSKKLKGKHIRVETLSPYGLQGIIYDDGKNQQIATNGFHEGIVIEIEGVERVFDNLYPEGKPIEQWFQDLVVIPGNRLNFVLVEQFE